MGDSLRDKPLWVAVDETTDACGRYVVNVVIGELDNEKYHLPYLVNCAFVDKPNSSSVARLVNDTLREVCENFTNFRLLLTDAAPYMIRCGRDLKVFYPNMLHITCLAHALHRVCEHVREMFPSVNELISSVKRVFLKAPSRVAIWRETCSLPLPPEPVLTRWGSWVKATLFYAENLEQVREVLMKLDSSEALSIETAQQCVRNVQLQADLVYIASHLAFLPDSITKMETAGLSLSDSFETLSKCKERIKHIPGEKGDMLRTKLSSVLSKNPDISIMENLHYAINGKTYNTSKLPKWMCPQDIVHFKFAPLVSVDVERSFSVYKNVLDDRRQQLIEENIRKIMVTRCFYNRHENDVD